MTIASDIECSAVNPLITGSDAPFGTMPLSRLTPSDYEEGIMEGIKLQNQEIEAICNQRSVPTFENTIVALGTFDQHDAERTPMESYPAGL